MKVGRTINRELRKNKNTRKDERKPERMPIQRSLFLFCFFFVSSIIKIIEINSTLFTSGKNTNSIVFKLITDRVKDQIKIQINSKIPIILILFVAIFRSRTV